METIIGNMEVLPIVNELEEVADYFSQLNLEIEESSTQEEFEGCKHVEWLLWRNISRLKKYAYCLETKNRAGFIVN